MATNGSTQASTPKLADFPDAEVVGGAVILDGKNMGTLTVTGEVELSPQGEAFILNAENPQPLTIKKIEEVPDPIPVGVIDPKDHTPVVARAKQAVRKRKQNEAVVDAMNSPTDEEEAAFKEADAAALAPQEGTAPPAPAPAPTAGVPRAAY